MGSYRDSEFWRPRATLSAWSCVVKRSTARVRDFVVNVFNTNYERRVEPCEPLEVPKYSRDPAGFEASQSERMLY